MNDSSEHSFKIVHIHTDPKFVSLNNSFNIPAFENTVFFIGNYFIIDNKHFNLIFAQSKNEINKLIEIASAADIVVLYGLEFYKSYICNRLPPKVKIIWRFFGSELYNRMPNVIYSDSTLKELQVNYSFTKTIVKNWARLMLFLKFRSSSRKELPSAMTRSNYFACLSIVEYCYLKEKFTFLPKFLQLPIGSNVNKSTLNFIDISQKQRCIIIGNSKNAYNNHLDVLDVLLRSKNNYNYLMFFSYGPEKLYVSKVRAIANTVSNLNIIDEYKTKDQLFEIYGYASAFVLNGFRQMAMFNIFTALRSSVKLYLNKKNPIYSWLQQEGFIVFSIDDLEADLQLYNITLTNKQARHNYDAFVAITEKYSIKQYTLDLLSIATDFESI